MQAELNELSEKSLFRSLKEIELRPNGRIRHNNRELLNFCSNDYLGISETIDIQTAIDNHSVTIGSGASRLISGNDPSFGELEDAVAELKETETCLVFSCGYMANLGVITSMVGRGDAVFSDRLNHASIVDGIILSGAKHFRYRHNDIDHLHSLLKKGTSYKRKLIVTESLFSMDGDLALLTDLVELKDKFKTMLMVDEAHSGGVYGKNGAGLVNDMGLAHRVDIQMGTFGKAYGCYGAYVVGSEVLRDYLVNKARSFIYTTALPPFINALNLEAIRIAVADDWRRIRLRENAAYFRNGLKQMNMDIGNSVSHIVPLIIGRDSMAVTLSKALWDRGIATVGIRPPTVPQNTARIRFSIMATHKKDDLSRALDAIKMAFDEF
jgi:8-amino-7-oxononanoate synthase